MDVIIFGATGMVGQAVLRESLLDPQIHRIVTFGRTPTNQRHVKVHEIVASDLFDLSPYESQLTGLDACFFCLGVSAAGMSEEAYSRMTYDLTVTIAERLARLNPQMTFLYVSGAGTDSSEKGRTMWARVKGRTENALLRMPFKAAYMVRPAGIRPMHGVRSKTRLYRFFYIATAPLMPLLARFPKWMTTSEQLGRAMIAAAKRGAPKQVLESADINAM
jgi:uncharacterized protein YbjT (DUF2867 family)